MATPARFRSHCRLLRMATLCVFFGLCLLLALAQPWRWLAATEGRGLFELLRLVPALGYLWALWAVQRALGGLAAGRLFHPTVAAGMRQIGAGVLFGALFNVFAVTNLARWIEGGRGSYAYFDLASIVLGVVGAALILLAQLVDQARGLQAELDEIL